MTTTKWSPYTALCYGCRRPFRISQEMLSLHLEYTDCTTEAEAADGFEFCHECASGVPLPGEYDVPEKVEK